MNICLVALDYPTAGGGGGVGSQTQSLARALVKLGHRVTVINLANPDGGGPVGDQGVRVHRVSRGPLHWYASKLPWLGDIIAAPLREIEDSWRVYRVVQRLHQSDPFDILEGTETGMICIALLLRRVPRIIRLHGERYTFNKYTPGLPLTLGDRMTRVVQRVALRRVVALVSPSHAHASEIAEELRGVHPPISIVANASPAPLDGPAGGKSPGPNAGSPTVLYVGRLDRQKGIPVLLGAAKRVVRRIPEARFILAGGNHPNLHGDEVVALVRRNGLTEHVRLLGHVPSTSLPEHYRSATVSVLPSYYETFGLAALEPMTYGVPVVASAVGGLTEVIAHGETGLLVAPGDPEALSEAILRLLTDRELAARFGKAGQARAKNRFSVEQQMELNLGLYRSLVPEPLSVDAGNHIFFSPHYNDAVFSCGGLIGELRDRRADVTVVTVFGPSDGLPLSAFARHVRQKWGAIDARSTRAMEDRAALRVLQVEHVQQWNRVEATDRLSKDGKALYACYEELSGEVASNDPEVGEALLDTIRRLLDRQPAAATLYFPLALGHHVDHQIVHQAGLRLAAQRYRVRFYEDWPYAENFEPIAGDLRWRARTTEIEPKRKARAAAEYRSQLAGVGRSIATLGERLARFAARTGTTRPCERFWTLNAGTMYGSKPPHPPFRACAQRRSRWALGAALAILRTPQLREALPPGPGLCVLVGRFSRIDKQQATEQGYHTMDMSVDQILDGDAFPAASAVVLGTLRVDQHGVELMAKIANVLPPGGVMCTRAEIGRAEEVCSLLGSLGFQDLHTRPAVFNCARDVPDVPEFVESSLQMAKMVLRIAPPARSREIFIVGRKGAHTPVARLSLNAHSGASRTT